MLVFLPFAAFVLISLLNSLIMSVQYSLNSFLNALLLNDATVPFKLAASVVYFGMLAKAFANRLEIKNGTLSTGSLNKENSLQLSQLIEVAGDAGSYANDFKEKIILEFSDGHFVPLEVEDYDEDALRRFLALLKLNNPSANQSFADIIPLESRGLLRFLSGTAQSDSLIAELSRTPTEDLVISLIKSNERRFVKMLLAVAVLAMCAISLIHNSMDLDKWQGESHDTSRHAEIESARIKLKHMEQTNPANVIDVSLLKVQLFILAAADYLEKDGLATFEVVWLGVGLIVLSIPTLRAVSPQFVFVDSRSIGMGRRFLDTEKIRQVSIKKLNSTADSLDGVLVLQDHIGSVSIELDRICNFQQRQLLLSLVERYAKDAKFDNEFMRTSNSMMDIQFTDIWLQSQEQPSAAETDSELTGKHLRDGMYHVQSVLGYGGQGTTYLADKLGQRVVVKESVLPSQADVRVTIEAIDRFERGAELLKNLHHDRIVRLQEYFIENGKAYLILEYLTGQTLRQFITENGALSPEDCISYAIQICEILEYLHGRQPQIIHCDLAPDNFILGADGQIRLLDFDVARVIDSESRGLIAGRPAYTPPEQFRGKPTSQSDLFALGGVMYFMIEGNDPPPLAKPTVTDPLHAHGPIANLILTCLSFDASKRPQTASKLKELLNELPQTISTPLNDQVVPTEEAPQRVLLDEAALEESPPLGAHFVK